MVLCSIEKGIGASQRDPTRNYQKAKKTDQGKTPPQRLPLNFID